MSEDILKKLLDYIDARIYEETQPPQWVTSAFDDPPKRRSTILREELVKLLKQEPTP